MEFLRNKTTRALIIIMTALVIAGIIIARTYYNSQNKAVDPRVAPAREMYARYDHYAGEGDYYRIFALLDSVENIYKAYPHYNNSFELGVVCNNRAAALITIALFSDSIRADYNPWTDLPPDSIMTRAEFYINKAISIYDSWTLKYSSKSREEIAGLIEEDFRKGMLTDDNDSLLMYLEARAKEIITAVGETDRRLSVCYTNLGVIKRHRKEYEDAVSCYQKALELWDRNLSAENNLNILLGRPLKKRNIIQKLFPPEK
ncbi:MAG TPA: hypothetical protein ENH59_07950 [Bacteroidetes bacterium]|nr:hypothetical protein [Bacteroidota bacterium]